ncbi:TVP38/TMEM64 family protein [Romboutsia maritimum]|uniref:TVP38/TMEM64 family membrane protein n=1 Tax=Romboutsia maritimum TaxID=2020948 RepID=A0A371ITZ2_9FIRM|nr:VTT domain-containing protein [Romboutsia maritimum]RDY23929.1 TVP38/TMEM64 family protein [Romboutsia maritimum]
MEYIEKLFYIAQDYWFLTMIVGLFSTFIESFLPVLPLVGIVTANAAILGLWVGLIISWIGSGLGTIAVFLIVSKFNNNKIFNRLRNDKTDKAINWIEKQGFRLLFIAYSCPFIPGCLVTLASAFCKRTSKSFIPAMLSGKFVMFLVVSYVASDIKGFITNPLKIAVFVLLVFLSWKIGSKVNVSLEKNNNSNNKIKDSKLYE